MQSEYITTKVVSLIAGHG